MVRTDDPKTKKWCIGMLCLAALFGFLAFGSGIVVFTLEMHDQVAVSFTLGYASGGEILPLLANILGMFF